MQEFSFRILFLLHNYSLQIWLQVSLLLLFFPTLFILALQKEVIPNLRGWELYSTSLKKHCLLKLFEVLLYGSVIYLFSHLFISVWTHGYLYTFSYNSILIYFFALIVPAWVTGGSVIWPLCPFDTLSSLCLFVCLSTYLLSCCKKHSSCMFSVLVLEIAISLRIPSFFYLRLILETKI